MGFSPCLLKISDITAVKLSIELRKQACFFRGCCTNNNLYSVRFCCLAFPGGVLGAG